MNGAVLMTATPSSSSDDVVRCQSLRDKLRNLHYFQPFGVESCSLVEKLLDDVLKAVENFEVLAKRYDKNAKRLQENQDLITSLKNANLKLVEENANLHSTIRSSDKKYTDLENEYHSTVKHLEDTENQRQDKRSISDLDSRKNGLETDRRLSVINVELQLKQQECDDVNTELELCQNQLKKERREHEVELKKLQEEVLRANQAHGALEQRMLESGQQNTVEEKKSVPMIILSNSQSSTTRKRSVSPPSQNSNVENRFQLDHGRKIALLEEKISQLERNLRIERRRSHKHLKLKEDLVDEIERKTQEVERLETLNMLQRRKNPHLSLIPTLSPQSKRHENEPSIEVEEHDTSISEFDEPRNPPISQLLSTQNNSITPPCCSMSQTDPQLRPLLAHYFRSVSPITRMNSSSINHQDSSLSPLSVPRRLSASMPIIESRTPPFSGTLNCHPVNQSTILQDRGVDFGDDTAILDLRADKRKLRQQLLSVEEALHAALRSKSELQRNAELREQSIRTQQATFNRKIGLLTSELTSLKARIADALKIREDLERHVAEKDSTILILEERIDLFARRISELSMEAAEEAQAGTASLREAIETSQQREVEISSLRAMNTTLTSRLASAESACRRLAESTKDIHVSFEAANNEAEKLKGVLLQTQIYLDEKETEFLELYNDFNAMKEDLEKLRERAEKATELENQLMELSEQMVKEKECMAEMSEKCLLANKKRIEAEQQMIDLKKEAMEISKAMEKSADSIAEQQNELIRTKEKNRSLIKIQQELQEKEEQLTKESRHYKNECQNLKSNIVKLEQRLDQYRAAYKVQQELAEALKKKHVQTHSTISDFTSRSACSSTGGDSARGILKSSVICTDDIPEYTSQNSNNQNGSHPSKGILDAEIFSNSFREFEKRKRVSIDDSELQKRLEDSYQEKNESVDFQTPKPIMQK